MFACCVPGVALFFSGADMNMYTKEPKTLEAQLDLLIQRGLVVADRVTALKWLSQVSYYRLRGYTYPLQNNRLPDHPFKQPTKIESIQMLYEFDRELRLLVLDAIERVEIATRTQIVLEMSLAHGAWWYEKPELFASQDLLQRDLTEIDKELDRSQEIFIEHYRSEYGDPIRPPSWMTLEVVSFGNLSKIFQNVRIGVEAKKRILAWFGLEAGGARIFESWLHHLSTVRNICAHHSRLWNRVAKQPPQYAPRLEKPWVPAFPDPQKMYATLSLLAWLTHKITETDSWKISLLQLLARYPKLNPQSLGFPVDWQSISFWQQKGATS